MTPPGTCRSYACSFCRAPDQGGVLHCHLPTRILLLSTSSSAKASDVHTTDCLPRVCVCVCKVRKTKCYKMSINTHTHTDMVAFMFHTQSPLGPFCKCVGAGRRFLPRLCNATPFCSHAGTQCVATARPS